MEKKILLGNEAIVQGALDSGVDFVSTYPGTPASEIGDIFYQIQNPKSKFQIKSKIQNPNLYFEYSVNEKVALEAAAGAAFCGQKALCAMKGFGLNVASDSFFPLAYAGIEGALVIVVADDPQCWSSAQSEQDSRYYAKMAHMPMLEPSCPSECYEFTKSAFDLSEKFKIPVMVRTTTRVAHQSGLVEIQNPKLKIQNKSKIQNLKFKTGIHKFSTMPPRVLEMKKELLQKIEKIRKVSEQSPINLELKSQQPAASSQRLGIITFGVSYNYVMDACRDLEIKLPILKLGFTHPLPEEKISKFLKPLKQALIVEELEPYLEEQIFALTKEANPKIKIYGKDLLPQVGELKTEHLIIALARTLNKKTKFDPKKSLQQLQQLQQLAHLKRTPVLCPGCPYHTVFGAVKKVAPNAVFGGDIGCYMLSIYPPYQLQDWLISMGASIGIGHGVANSLKSKIQNPKSKINPKLKIKNSKQKVISFVGDSTFFHAGIPALINCVANNSNPLIIILDNQTTAMTGHQPHPGMMGIKIEDIVSACGVKNLKIVDSFKFQEVELAVKEFLSKDEVSVIIARGKCKLSK